MLFLKLFSASISVTDILILAFILFVLVSGGFILYKFLKGGGDNW